MRSASDEVSALAQRLRRPMISAGCRSSVLGSRHQDPPHGYVLAELLVASTLCAIVCAAILGTLTSATRLVRSQVEHVAWSEARRVVSAVLDDELRYLDPATDLAVATDTVGVRAVRGLGTACHARSDGAVVRYSGARLPEPAKDSVLILDAAIGDRALPLNAVRRSETAPAACRATPDVTILTLRSSEPIPLGSLILVFEAGSYHLADRAFRYRRGLSGRQPLTAEVFAANPGQFRKQVGEAGLELTLIRSQLGAMSRGGPAQADGEQDEPVRHRVGLLNGTPRDRSSEDLDDADAARTTGTAGAPRVREGSSP